ncbi:UDP-glucuronosyltransferase 2B15-like [Amphiura filiformis]|uniref:UDP-glucuronosyltransferase 2B15-like n=1 Tax=Amphiura filiformis TaxID=82378 RepID=UPI003B220CF9
MGFIMSFSRWFIIIALFVPFLHASRFLIIFGPENGSHFMMCARIGQTLASRGHSVTFLISENLEEILDQYHFENITLEIYPTMIPKRTILNLQTRLSKELITGNIALQTLLHLGDEMFHVLENSTIDTLGNSALMHRLQNQNFDLVFFDILYIYPVFIAKKLKVPFAPMSFMVSLDITAWINRADFSTSYYPGQSVYDNQMTLMQRLQNTLRSKVMLVFQHYYFARTHHVKDHFGICPDKSTVEMLGKAELLFMRTHFALDFPRSLPAHVVPIGGILTKPAAPLSQDLNAFVESSGDSGVIVFSLGTYVNYMEEEQALLFKQAFSQLGEKVIWRFLGDSPGNISRNTLTLPWIPQNDILGHTQTRLLIYHCGSNGVFEALYHAVPIICLPLFADQFGVAARVVSKGIGLQLDITSLTSDKLVRAIRHVVDNQSYKNNMKRLSTIFKDEPMGSPMNRAVYWMEFIGKHGNASHLRSSAHDLNFIQYHLIDVIATLLLSAVVSIAVIFKSLQFVCRLFFVEGNSKKSGTFKND